MRYLISFYLFLSLRKENLSDNFFFFEKVFLIKFTLSRLNPKYRRRLNVTIIIAQRNKVNRLPNLDKSMRFNKRPINAVGSKNNTLKSKNFR